MNIRPKIICSGKAIKSPGAVSSGWQRLVAFAQDCCISIIDPKTSNIVQSLNHHSEPVTKITWAPENYYHDSKNPYLHRLASSDVSGKIVIWNVVSATPMAEAYEKDSGVCDMHWISDQEISRDLLLVLHTDNKLILWNAQTCSPLWRKVYSHNIHSIALDPFASQNLILHGSNKFIVLKDLSWNMAPDNTGRLIVVCDSNPALDKDDCDASRNRLSKSIKATAKAVIGHGLFRSPNPQRGAVKSPTNTSSAFNEAPIQILYHAFRKQHAIFVFPREIVVYDLVLAQNVGEIRLDQVSATFVQVYSCRQADALICLHQNGTVSLHCCPPTQQGAAPTNAEGVFARPPLDVCYRFLCESKSLRRGKNFGVVAMSVDPTTELGITIATSDGRLQFLSIENDAPTNSDWPQWTLMDMVKSMDSDEFTNEATSLHIRFAGFYTGGSPSPTVCSVCPSHFLQPFADKLKHHSLLAVGTARGSVQIWDLHTTKIWREYLMVNGPVYGLAWGTLSCSPSSDSVNNPSPDGLAVFVHSCQTSDNPGGQDSTGGTGPGVRNTVVRIDLATGRQRIVPTQSADTKELHLLRLAMQDTGSAAKPSKWLNVASRMTDMAAAGVTPIRSLKTSNLGQYLAILYKNWPLEIWDAQKLVLLHTFSNDRFRPAALTWSNVKLPSQSPSAAGASESNSPSPSGDSGGSSDRYKRETFILCTSPLSLQLFTVEGTTLDTMPISNTIVKSLPVYSRNGITCASWRSPMIAFGMADGCVAVRNLQTKETLTRHMGILVSDGAGAFPSPLLSASADTLGEETRQGMPVADADMTSPCYVKKVEFLFADDSVCRLLALCTGGIAVWEPKKMVLLCAARFGNTPQRILIDASWTTPGQTQTQTATAPICALLARDGSLRLAAAGSTEANRSLLPSEETSTKSPLLFSADNDSLDTAEDYLPLSQFEFNSSLAADADFSGFLYQPSMLPTNVALTIRHLLQHQPWRSKGAETTAEGIAVAMGADKDQKEAPSAAKVIVLTCPDLGANFANVQSAVDRFFTELRRTKHLSAPFESSELSIVERCLLTAQHFGDTYEMAFWRVAAYRLLRQSGDDENCPDSGLVARRRRFFQLDDLVWEELTAEKTYRSAVVERINRLLHDPNPELSALCTRFLLLLGYRKEAIKHLAETPTSSPQFTHNIHRACLLASQGYIRDLEDACSGTGTVLASVAANHASSVKLLAASLVSNGHLQEGVEMLCSLDMHLDACRYLEAYNEWETAVFLAKCKLGKKDSEGVLKRWASYLASTANRKSAAILILVYLGQHAAVLSLLQSLRQHQLAARYLEACLECGAINSDPKSDNLHAQVFVEFARCLISIGQREAALYYAELAGESGRSLREEIDFMLN